MASPNQTPNQTLKASRLFRSTVSLLVAITTLLLFFQNCEQSLTLDQLPPEELEVEVQRKLGGGTYQGQEIFNDCTDRNEAPDAVCALWHSRSLVAPVEARVAGSGEQSGEFQFKAGCQIITGRLSVIGQGRYLRSGLFEVPVQLADAAHTEDSECLPVSDRQTDLDRRLAQEVLQIQFLDLSQDGTSEQVLGLVLRSGRLVLGRIPQ